MSKMKKITCLIMCALMLIGVFPFMQSLTAYAEGGVKIRVSGQKDGVITVALYLTEAIGVTGGTFDFTYDPAVFSVGGTVEGDADTTIINPAFAEDTVKIGFTYMDSCRVDPMLLCTINLNVIDGSAASSDISVSGSLSGGSGGSVSGSKTITLEQSVETTQEAKPSEPETRPAEEATTSVAPQLPEAVTLKLNASRSVAAGNSLTYLKYVPTFTGQYVLYSTGNMDTVAYLYDSAMNEIAYNDYGGDEAGNNFKLTYKLTKGETYYFGVRTYWGSQDSFKVFFEHVHGSKLTREPITVASCTAAGKDHVVCSVCGLDKEETVPKLLHRDENRDGVCDQCKQTIKATKKGEVDGNYWDEEQNAANVIKYTLMGDGTLKLTGKGSLDFYRLSEVLKNAVRLEIGEGIERIVYGYRNDTLTYISFPSTLTNINEQTFWWFTALKTVEVNKNNPVFSSVNGVLFNKDKTTLIYYPSARRASSYKIPSTVKEISLYAFDGAAALKTVEFPSGLKRIGYGAFDNTGWYKAQPDGALYAGKVLYSYKGDMSKLKTLAVRKGTVSVTGGAFSAYYHTAALTTLTLPDSLEEIGDTAFVRQDKLTSVTFGKGLKTIGVYAFSNTGVKTLALPAELKEIGQSAFYRTKISSVAIPEGVTTVGGNAFGGCENLKTIKVSDSVVFVDGNPAYGTPWYEAQPDGPYYFGRVLLGYKGDSFNSLKKLTVKAGTKSVSSGAFYNWFDLSTLSLPASLLYIGDYAFGHCNLTKVTFGGTKELWATVKLGSENDSLNYADIAFLTPSVKTSGIKLAKTKLAYNGKVQKPAVTVKDVNGKTISSTYYTLKWSKTPKAVGSYTVKVTLKAPYAGTKTLSFTIVPARVTGVKRAASTTKSVKLTWTKATGAKYYEVYGSVDGKTYHKLSTVTVNALNATKIGGKALAAGKTYWFKVRALDSTKKLIGAYSAALKTGTKTAAPKITKLTSAKSNTATLTWGKVTGAKSYVVYKSADNKTWVKAGTTAGTSFTLTKLTGGKRIYVKVLAVNAYKVNSAYSAVKYVTVKK